MRLSRPPQGANLSRQEAFTIVEAIVAIAVLMIFAVTSTMTLNFFDERATRNRNSEAARAIVEDYVNCLLNDTGSKYTATGDGTDLDGDGAPEGVLCVGTLPFGRTIPASIPLIVKRVANPLATNPDGTNGVVVSGMLYWRLVPVGTAYGCTANTDLMQATFTLQYTYRSQTYYYKTTTFKANGTN